MLSAYELQRLENIQRNQDVLKALGLGDARNACRIEKPKKPSKQKEREYKPYIPPDNLLPRMSLRCAGKRPIYSDTEANAEIERIIRQEEGHRRPGRPRNPPKRYEDDYGQLEDEYDDEIYTKRRKQRTKQEIEQDKTDKQERKRSKIEQRELKIQMMKQMELNPLPEDENGQAYIN